MLFYFAYSLLSVMSLSPLFEYLCNFAFYIRGSLLGLKFSYQTSFGIWLYQYLLVCLGIISTTPEDYLMSTSDLYYVFHI